MDRAFTNEKVGSGSLPGRVKLKPKDSLSQLPCLHSAIRLSLRVRYALNRERTRVVLVYFKQKFGTPEYRLTGVQAASWFKSVIPNWWCAKDYQVVRKLIIFWKVNFLFSVCNILFQLVQHSLTLSLLQVTISAFRVYCRARYLKAVNHPANSGGL